MALPLARIGIPKENSLVIYCRSPWLPEGTPVLGIYDNVTKKFNNIVLAGIPNSFCLDKIIVFNSKRLVAIPSNFYNITHLYTSEDGGYHWSPLPGSDAIVNEILDAMPWRYFNNRWTDFEISHVVLDPTTALLYIMRPRSAGATTGNSILIKLKNFGASFEVITPTVANLDTGTISSIELKYSRVSDIKPQVVLSESQVRAMYPWRLDNVVHYTPEFFNYSPIWEGSSANMDWHIDNLPFARGFIDAPGSYNGFIFVHKIMLEDLSLTKHFEITTESMIVQINPVLVDSNQGDLGLINVSQSMQYPDTEVLDPSLHIGTDYPFYETSHFVPRNRFISLGNTDSNILLASHYISELYDVCISKMGHDYLEENTSLGVNTHVLLSSINQGTSWDIYKTLHKDVVLSSDYNTSGQVRELHTGFFKKIDDNTCLFTGYTYLPDCNISDHATKRNKDVVTRNLPSRAPAYPPPSSDYGFTISSLFPAISYSEDLLKNNCILYQISYNTKLKTLTTQLIDVPFELISKPHYSNHVLWGVFDICIVSSSTWLIVVSPMTADDRLNPDPELLIRDEYTFYILKSTDSGQNWHIVATVPIDKNAYPDYSKSVEYNWLTEVWRNNTFNFIKVTDTLIVLGYGVGPTIYIQSNNSGDTWKTIGIKLPSLNLYPSRASSQWNLPNLVDGINDVVYIPKY